MPQQRALHLDDLVAQLRERRIEGVVAGRAQHEHHELVAACQPRVERRKSPRSTVVSLALRGERREHEQLHGRTSTRLRRSSVKNDESLPPLRASLAAWWAQQATGASRATGAGTPSVAA